VDSLLCTQFLLELITFVTHLSSELNLRKGWPLICNKAWLNVLMVFPVYGRSSKECTRNSSQGWYVFGTGFELVL
jgi:hypothetical protein